LKFQVPAPTTYFQINFQYFHVVCRHVAYIKLWKWNVVDKGMADKRCRRWGTLLWSYKKTLAEDMLYQSPAILHIQID